MYRKARKCYLLEDQNVVDMWQKVALCCTTCKERLGKVILEGQNIFICCKKVVFCSVKCIDMPSFSKIKWCGYISEMFYSCIKSIVGIAVDHLLEKQKVWV